MPNGPSRKGDNLYAKLAHDDVMKLKRQHSRKPQALCRAGETSGMGQAQRAEHDRNIVGRDAAGKGNAISASASASAHGYSECSPAGSEGTRTFQMYIQVGGETGRADPPFQGPDQRRTQNLEVRSDGPEVSSAMAPLPARTRPNVPRYHHQVSRLVRRQLQ